MLFAFLRLGNTAVANLLNKGKTHVCHRRTSGDTAQVGAELAEWLGIPHVACVKSVDRVGPDSIDVTVDLPDREVAQRVPYPVLLAVEKGIFEPRLPSYTLLKKTADRPISWLAHGDLPDADPTHYGLDGSPTQVKRIFPPDAREERTMLEGDAKTQAAALADLLEERKFLR